MYRVSVVLAVLWVCGGCTAVGANRFRVVDAINGQPIEGVRVTGTFGRYQPACPGLFPVVCPVSAGSGITDKAGLVQLEDDLVNEADFYKEGYEPCGIVTGWGGYKVRGRFWDWRAFPQDEDRTVKISLQPCKQSAARILYIAGPKMPPARSVSEGLKRLPFFVPENESTSLGNDAPAMLESN